MHNPKTPKGDPKTKGKRYTLTLRGVYSGFLDDMVEQGVYLEPQDALRAGLRLLFEKHGVELYIKKSETTP
ncbi:unnamed protein product [marine sediment metagenome]|uniref:Uncharacterized protein n=1 Tax=marine sediment metagenome TaxID=412755 RepID=X1KES2_9ZZZZ